MSTSKDDFCLICNANIANTSSVTITHHIENSTPMLTLYQFLQSITNFKHLDITKVSQNVCQKCCVQILALYNFQLQCNKAVENLQNAENQKKMDHGKIIITTYILKTSANKAKVVNQVGNQENQKAEEVFAESLPEIATEVEDEKNSDPNDDWFIPTDKDKELTEEQKVKKELYAKHKNRKSECKVCKKVICLRNMKIHLRTHTGEQPYSCEICSRSFSVLSSLKDHIKRHKNERPNLCTVCGASFHRTTSLKHHMYTHSERPYSCNVCGKKFIYENACKAHEKVHSDNPPPPKTFPCKKCPKVYKFWQDLRYHMYSHGLVMPFECTICGKRFPRSDRLKAHQLKSCPGRKIENVETNIVNVGNADPMGGVCESSSS